MPAPKTREVWKGPIPEDRAGKPGRPMIIVEVLDANRVKVLYGGSSPHPGGKHWRVDIHSSTASEMGLTGTTHFRHGSVSIVQTDLLRGQMGSCPYDDFLTVEEIVWEFERAAGR